MSPDWTHFHLPVVSPRGTITRNDLAPGRSGVMITNPGGRFWMQIVARLNAGFGEHGDLTFLAHAHTLGANRFMVRQGNVNDPAVGG